MASKKKTKRQKITTQRFFEEQADPLQMKLVAGKSGLSRSIIEPTVNRPSLALAGFTKYIAYKRIQVIGNAEAYYLKSLSVGERTKRYKKLCSYKIPCIVYTRNLPIDRQLKSIANEAGVPIFQTPMVTMRFVNLATIELDLLFAPRDSVIGSMVDVHGIGVLIRGESGIGKSETVLELIEKGYSLVSDDITKVTLLDGREIIGTSSELSRNHMEVRGIGIINVGATECRLAKRAGILSESFTNKGDRRHFVRVAINPLGQVSSSGGQRSHMLRSLANANALLDLPPESHLTKGESVEVLIIED